MTHFSFSGVQRYRHIRYQIRRHFDGVIALCVEHRLKPEGLLSAGLPLSER